MCQEELCIATLLLDEALSKQKKNYLRPKSVSIFNGIIWCNDSIFSYNIFVSGVLLHIYTTRQSTHPQPNDFTFTYFQQNLASSRPVMRKDNKPISMRVFFSNCIFADRITKTHWGRVPWWWFRICKHVISLSALSNVNQIVAILFVCLLDEWNFFKEIFGYWRF